jgi:hypothetical protein
VAGGDDTTRPRRQGLSSFLKINWSSHFLWNGGKHCGIKSFGKRTEGSKICTLKHGRKNKQS